MPDTTAALTAPDRDDVYATLRKLNRGSAELAQQFDITPRLTDCVAGLGSLLLAYEQWKAYHELNAGITQAIADGMLTQSNISCRFA